MTASQQFKGLLAGVATVALIGTAFAQGNPPNPAVKSAPVGAGQQSSQGTPMGTTGTPTGGGSTTAPARSPSTTGSSSTMGTPSTSSTPMTSGTAGSTSGSTMGSTTTTSSDTTMASAGGKSKRRARADRN